MNKYIVKDSLGNTMRVFDSQKQAYNYKYTFGNFKWKIIIMMLMLVFSFTANAQYVQQGNNFVYQTQKVNKEKEIPTKTKYTVEKDGVKYPVYITKRGSCFIIRISKKTGKEYRQYLPKEIANKISKEYNIII